MQPVQTYQRRLQRQAAQTPPFPSRREDVVCAGSRFPVLAPGQIACAAVSTEAVCPGARCAFSRHASRSYPGAGQVQGEAGPEGQAVCRCQCLEAGVCVLME